MDTCKKGICDVEDDERGCREKQVKTICVFDMANAPVMATSAHTDYTHADTHTYTHTVIFICSKSSFLLHQDVWDVQTMSQKTAITENTH